MKKLGMDYRFHELRHFMATSMAASVLVFVRLPVGWATLIRRLPCERTPLA
jgi:hypothetical protein